MIESPLVGKPAPDITLLDGSGRTWRLTDQRGRNQILIFHRHIH